MATCDAQRHLFLARFTSLMIQGALYVRYMVDNPA